jgi:hypothetical protein
MLEDIWRIFTEKVCSKRKHYDAEYFHPGISLTMNFSHIQGELKLRKK